MLFTFNSATELLLKAQLAFDAENFDDALNYAKSVKEIGNSLIGEVEKMKIDVFSTQIHELMMVLLVSGLGFLIVEVSSKLQY